MNKFKVLILLVVIMVIGAFAVFITQFAPIISGFGSKSVCSCTFIGQRNFQSVLNNELGAFPLSLGSFSVQLEDSTATGSVFGFAKTKAVFRKGLGCTLLNEKTEQKLKAHLPKLTTSKTPLSDTIDWPLGSRMGKVGVDEVDMDILNDAVKFAFENTHETLPAKTRSVVVVYKGKLIAEAYGDEFNASMPQLGWSMNKSITNAFYGIMQKNGMLNIEDKAPLKAWQNNAEKYGEITINNLLQMNSGLHWEEVYSTVSTATNMLYTKADMGSFAASQPVEFTPKEHWYYSSGTTNILSLIMREQLGDKAYYQFPYKELFQKIGVNSATLELDASGTYVASSYMWATPRDWARIGLLYLQNGNWFGNQILPTEWVRYTVQPSPTAPMQEYGAHFWLNLGEINNPDNRFVTGAPTDLFMMKGYEGQWVFIIPSKELVVVRTGQNKRGAFDQNAFISKVISAIK